MALLLDRPRSGLVPVFGKKWKMPALMRNFLLCENWKLRIQ
jgi:hypothetical protein